MPCPTSPPDIIFLVFLVTVPAVGGVVATVSSVAIGATHDRLYEAGPRALESLTEVLRAALSR